MIAGLIFSWNSLLLLVTVVVGYCAYFYAKQAADRLTGKRPPGPWGVPYLGALLSVEAALHKYFEKVNLTYGPICQIDMGVKPTVLVQDPDVLRTVYKNSVSNGRKQDPSTDFWVEQNWGMFFRNGDAGWRVQRKAGLKAMQLYSTAKNAKLSAVCEHSLKGFYAFLEENAGKPVEVRNEVFHLTGSIAANMVYGLDCGYEDERQRWISKYSSEMVSDFAATMVLGNLPILKPFYYFKIQKQKRELVKFTQYCKDLIREHTFTGDVTTIADALKKARDEITEAELAGTGFGREQLELVAIDLYTAGMFDTAENTIWLLVLLAAHQDFQQQLFDQIQEVTGGSRAVSSADQGDVLLGWAAVHEALRFASTVPFTMPHNLTEDLTIASYAIPKDTEVMGNAWMMHRDPKVFPEPDAFKPERWIHEGKLRPELGQNLFAFSTGGRRCIGEGFAKQELFVLATNVVQNFTVELDLDTPGNALEHQYTVTMSPGPHKLIFRKR